MQPDYAAVEQAYAFFHQKEKVYRFSASEQEKDHIEDAISSYVNRMSPALYSALSEGSTSYLREHTSFHDDLRDAGSKLEKMLDKR